MAEVEVAREGAVQTITLNRPDKLNAFTRAVQMPRLFAYRDFASSARARPRSPSSLCVAKGA